MSRNVINATENLQKTDSSEKKVIVVDIDNTIITQNIRKQKILHDLFLIDKTIDEINKDFFLIETFKQYAKSKKISLDKVKNRFNEVFFSDAYNEETYFSIISMADKYLKKISDNFKIIYLTSRHAKQNSLTEAQLKFFGFPKGDIIAYSGDENCDCTDYESFSFSFKSDALKKIDMGTEIILCVGDSISDIAAYSSAGLQSVLLTAHVKEEDLEKNIGKYIDKDKFDPYSVHCLENWKDIYDFLQYILNGDDELDKIIEEQTVDYVNFLSDLDNKSSMILLIATFCATALFSAIVEGALSSHLFLIIMGCLGIFFSLLSVYFAIVSFSSKVTFGNENILSIIFSIFFRKNKTAPYIQKNLVAKTKFIKTARLKHLYSRYKTFDSHDIRTRLLFSTRATNYQKIYPEFKAKICLFLTLVILFAIIVFKSISFIIALYAC